MLFTLNNVTTTLLAVCHTLDLHLVFGPSAEAKSPASGNVQVLFTFGNVTKTLFAKMMSSHYYKASQFEKLQDALKKARTAGCASRKDPHHGKLHIWDMRPWWAGFESATGPGPGSVSGLRSGVHTKRPESA